jgi:hypothetical protein
LKVPLWRLENGPELAASVRDANPGAGRRYEENLQALRDSIECSPYLYGRALVDEMPDVRYGTTKDVAEGYRLVCCFRVDRDAKRVELGWVMIEWL